MSEQQMVGGVAQQAGVLLTSGENFDVLVKQVHATFHDRMAKYGPKLFFTDSKNLSTTYRKGFPEAEQQHHNCTCCRNFFNRFGAMVFIDENGKSVPALWDSSVVPEEYRASVAALEKRVGNTAVLGIFYTPFDKWGEAVTPVFEEGTNKQLANWTHHTAPVVAECVVVEEQIGTLQGIFNTDTDCLVEAVNRYSLSNIALAITSLSPLRGVEKYVKQLEWLHGVVKRAKDLNDNAKRNLVMREVSLLEDRQWSRIATNVLGNTFLDLIQRGRSIEQALKSFLTQIDPENYRQQTAAPTEGNIKVTQDIFADLGLGEDDLHRRMASISELRGISWTPKADAPAEAPKVDKPFGGLETKQSKAKPAEVSSKVVDGGRITVARLKADILPKATALHVRLPYAGKFIYFTNASKAEPGRVFFYDREDDRNTLACHTTVNPVHVHLYGKASGQMVPVRCISSTPATWTGGDRAEPMGSDVMILDGFKEFRNEPGLALFPQLLRSELYQAERVISAFSKKHKIDLSTEDQAIGVALNGADEWRIRVTTEFGVTDYVIDRLS